MSVCRCECRGYAQGTGAPALDDKQNAIPREVKGSGASMTTMAHALVSQSINPYRNLNQTFVAQG